jgi:hypothetical protein
MLHRELTIIIIVVFIRRMSTRNGFDGRCLAEYTENNYNASMRGRPDQSMWREVRHTCVFEKNTGHLDRIVHALVAQEASKMWDAIVQFVGQSNIAISTAASP